MTTLKVQEEIRRGTTVYRVVFTHPETGKRTNRRWPDPAGAEAFVNAAATYTLAQAIAFDDGSRPGKSTTTPWSDVPFGTYAADHIRHRRGLKDTTRRNYLQRLRVVEGTPLALIPIRDVTHTHLEAFVDHLETLPSQRGVHLKDRSRRLVFSFVRGVLLDAYRKGDIPKNPAQHVDHIPVEDALDPVILEPRDFAAIAAQLEPEHVPFYAFALESGCRYSELCALEWRDLETDPDDPGLVAVTIRGGKSRAARRLTSVPQDVVASIVMSDADFVFPAPNRDTWRRRWIAAVQRAQSVVHVAPGFDPVTVSPRIHDLRHTHAVQMLTTGGMNLTALAARLGHSSPEITAAFYAHFGRSQVLSLGRVAMNSMAGFRTALEPTPVA